MKPPGARLVAAASVVLALLLATLIVFVVVHRSDVATSRSDREALARQSADVLRIALIQVTSGLQGAGAIVAANGQPDLAAFRAFADGLLASGLYESLALEAQVDTPGERARFERRIGHPINDLVARNRFQRAPARPAYFPVEAVVPTTTHSLRDVGFDIAANPDRGPALRSARDTGTVRMSGPLVLTGSGQRGIVAVAPLYARGAPAANAVERNEAIVGFVTAAVTASKLERVSRRRLPEGTRWRVMDDGELLLGERRRLERAAQASLSFAGRRWAVSAKPLSNDDADAAWLFLGGGLALTTMVAIVAAASLWRESVLVRARQRLLVSEERTRLLQTLTAELAGAESAADVFGILDREGLARLEIDMAAVYELSHDRSALVLVAQTSLGPGLDMRWQALDIRAESVIARVAKDREAIWIENRSSWREQFPASERSGPSQLEAFAALPLRGREQLLGVLVVGYRHAPEARPEYRTLLNTVAGQCGQALERIRLAESEHALAYTLQQDLLATELPEDDRFTIGVAYRPGAPPLGIGGDWHDVIPLEEGHYGLVVGDVVGHGAPAAALMGQLQSACRALAASAEGPADLLQELDRFVTTSHRGLGTTVVYATYDPATHELRYACAGHPPPLLVDDEGARFLEEARSPPLGAHADIGEARLTLATGCAVLLYTDGLVERPGSSIDDGLARLAEAAAAIGPDAAKLADDVISRLLGPTEIRDDIALLALGRTR